jgi:hypothetical protein
MISQPNAGREVWTTFRGLIVSEPAEYFATLGLSPETLASRRSWGVSSAARP